MEKISELKHNYEVLRKLLYLPGVGVDERRYIHAELDKVASEIKEYQSSNNAMWYKVSVDIDYIPQHIKVQIVARTREEAEKFALTYVRDSIGEFDVDYSLSNAVVGDPVCEADLNGGYLPGYAEITYVGQKEEKR